MDRKEYDQMADELQPTGHKVKTVLMLFYMVALWVSLLKGSWIFI